ncbi:hypothetical protein HKCCE2091_11855 [Rhodobacterales bacterium HKCCE2091]|nr:hypothetical protein [Rhodobacterales bacterium HKCCE2091]
MAAPFAPVAGIALKYAALAAAGFLAARMLPPKQTDPRFDAALDAMPDGVTLSGGSDTARAGLRLRRALRLGTGGLKLDAGVLARIRVSRA